MSLERLTQRRPRTLGDEQVLAVLGACEHLRDRLLVAMLVETGMRIGEAIGLRRCDVVPEACEVHVVPRDDNVNGARTKRACEVIIPVSMSLIRLYAAYLRDECGEVDSDYVFIDLWEEPRGRPLSRQAVYRLAEPLRAGSGVCFTWHTFRLTFGANLFRRHRAGENVAGLLTQRSSAMTTPYVQFDRAEMKEALGYFCFVDRDERTQDDSR